MDLDRASPFTESIILATICGRTLSHRQRSVVEHVYSHVPRHFKERQGLALHNSEDASGETFCFDTRWQCSTPTACCCSPTRWRRRRYFIPAGSSIPYHGSRTSTAGAISDFKQKPLAAAKGVVNLTKLFIPSKLFQGECYFLPLLFCLPFSSLPSSLPLFISSFLFRFSSFPLPLLCIMVNSTRPTRSLRFLWRSASSCFNTHRYLDESIEREVEEILEAFEGSEQHQRSRSGIIWLEGLGLNWRGPFLT